MIKFKRIAALALAGVMSVSMIGCGSEKKASKEVKNVDVSKVENIADAVNLLDSYKNGEMSTSIDMTLTHEGESAKLYLSASSENSGDDKRIGAYMDLDINGQKVTLNMPYGITMLDKRIYIDLGKFMKSFTDVDNEIGSYGLLAPEFDKSKMKEYREGSTGLVKGLINALTEGAEVSGSEGAFTAKITNADGCIKSLKAVIKYVDENREDIIKVMKNYQSLFDYKDYADKLFDDMEKDLLAAAEAGGLKLTKDQLADAKKKVIEAIDKREDNVDEDSINAAIDDLVAAMNGTGDDELLAAFDGITKSDIELNVKAEKEKYEVTYKIDFASEETTLKLEGNYLFNIKEVKVEKPINVKSLKEMVDYIQSDQSLMQKMMAGLSQYASRMKSGR